jgi:hypothetical protein
MVAFVNDGLGFERISVEEMWDQFTVLISNNPDRDAIRLGTGKGMRVMNNGFRYNGVPLTCQKSACRLRKP